VDVALMMGVSVAIDVIGGYTYRTSRNPK